MQLIKPDVNIDFIGKRKLGFILSIVLILVSIGSLIVHKGPNYGIDFAGGTIVQIQFDSVVTIEKIRQGLANIGLEKSSVQNFGKSQDNEYLIRTSQENAGKQGMSQAITEALSQSTGQEPVIRRVEYVGPQVGEDLRKKALLAIFYSLLFITIYISARFEDKLFISGITAGSLMVAVYFLSLANVSMPFLIACALIISLVLFWFLELKYAMGAIVALIHDVMITVGIFSILDLEFSLPIIAALLTIIGYSLNDTIIVFDRIRENIKGMDAAEIHPGIFNKSINETLSRTVLTSLTTLIVLFALYFLGGEIINNFTFAMIIGVLIGTYSSIFVASPMVLAATKR
ncbi:MAG: protein translocase subunit SecF [Desulfobacteraceae bacterium]|nr:MAG: protein translocase subunit SecF [Desulfobacteraceae bacterium]